MVLKMFKQKKSQAIFFGIMVSILTFVVVISLIPVLKSFITTGRDVDHLNCDGTGLSAGTIFACIITDWYMPYFIGACIAVAVGYISGKSAVNVIG